MNNALKHFYTISFLLILTAGFSQDSTDISNCISVGLEFNSGQLSDNNFFKPKGRVWYEIEKKDYVETAYLNLFNTTLGDSATLAIFDTIHCDSLPNNPIVSEILEPGLNSINLNNLDYDKTYYVVIYTNYLGRGSFKVSFEGEYKLSGCYFEVNKKNSVLEPQEIDPMSFGISRCFSSCNSFIPSESYQRIPRLHGQKGYKWYNIKESYTAAFLSLTSAAPSTHEICILQKGISTNDYRRIYTDTSESLSVIINYLPLDPTLHTLIGVRILDGDDESYSICCTVYPVHESCIDYLSEGDTLMPIGTSLGSNIEGPYQENEIVEFEYRIDKWRALNNTWLHSITPVISGPWKLLMDSIIQDSIVEWSISDENGEKPYWRWSAYDSTLLDTSHNKLQESCWHILNPSDHFFGTVPKSRFGEKVRHDEIPQLPYLSLRFKVRVDDSLNCNDLNECLIQIRPNTDYDSGLDYTVGCENNTESFNSTADCCIDPPIASLIDTQICDNEYMHIRLDGSSSCQTVAEIDEIFTGHNLKTGLNSFRLSTGNRQLRNYEIKIQFDCSNTCQSDTTLSINIAPEPNIDLEGDGVFCPGEDIIIRNEERNEYQELSYEWSAVGNESSDFSNLGNTFIQRADRNMAVRLELQNQFGCVNTDSVKVEVINISSPTHQDIEICPYDRDSILTLVDKNGDCVVSVVLPSGEVIKSRHVQLAEYGKYKVEIICDEGCPVYDSFQVKRWKPYDTVYVQQHLFVPIGYEESIRLEGTEIESRSSISKSTGCAYVKDTIYVVDNHRSDLTFFEPISVRPNPNNGSFLVKNNSKQDYFFKLIDSNGHEIRSGELTMKNQVNFSQIDKGMYFLVINILDRTIIEKIIVN